MGENSVTSDPDSNVVEERLDDLEFVVVQDIFPTGTVEYADVILPATSWAERGGTVSNTDRRVQRMRGIETVYPNTKHDLDILADVGTGLFGEDGGFDFGDPETVFEELREVCPIYHAMAYDLLGEEGLRWPCYEPGDEGDDYLYGEAFTTESGLAGSRASATSPRRRARTRSTR